eukprot:scaffold151558_cov26-Tisochrysis_lutea.AAC.2
MARVSSVLARLLTDSSSRLAAECAWVSDWSAASRSRSCLDADAASVAARWAAASAAESCRCQARRGGGCFAQNGARLHNQAALL